MLFLFICANIPKIARYKYLIKTKSYNIGFESKIIKLLTLYSRIAQALFLPSRICLIIRLPPFCCLSIVPWRRYVAGAKVFTRSSRTYKVEPCGSAENLPCDARYFRRNLVRLNLYTEKPLKRNDRNDRKTHKKNVG